MAIQHDGKIAIAEGNNRRVLVWKNTEWLWSGLSKKLSITHRTAETLAEYMVAKKQRQDEIKDVGGFVGGTLLKGRRGKGKVVSRHLITLDIDFGQQEIWEDFILLYDCAAVVYSTHKHTPEHPRLRLVIPLSREVFSDEYEPIARKVAEAIGIELFDPTTYQDYRLMYWPSTSKDGEFYFKQQDGPWLDPDTVLSQYRDWRDSTQWPTSVKEDTVIRQAIKKAGDPLEKTGVIGAFCRCYGIEEVIGTYLSDVYDSCDVPNRYTFKGGSTSAGLVVYEDKFTYSHHGTDPTSNKLCNAFDLVRIHKFADLDEKMAAGTPTVNSPSYRAMVEFCTKDAKVRRVIGEERYASAQTDFADDFAYETTQVADDTAWLSEMECDGKGRYLSSAHNISTVLENDINLKGKFALNLFDHRESALGNLPWRKVTAYDRALRNTDDAGLRVYFEKVYGITGKDKINDVFSLHLLKKGYHPIKDYLEKLNWDGQERLDTLLVDYFGAKDTDYTRAVIRKSLIAAIARIYKPGCKFDYILTLCGEEGTYKSTFIEKLGVKSEWYSSSITSLHGKEAMEQLQGSWIIEIAELAGFKKAEVETIKNFITTPVDKFRVAYGKRVEDFPRHCVFFGTTNKKDFLRAAEGNRRFWPVQVRLNEPIKSVANDLTPTEVGQIWAEAKYYFEQGEQLHLDKEMERIARIEQNVHTEQDARLGIVERFLSMKLPTDWGDMSHYDRRAFFQSLDDKDRITPDGTEDRERVSALEIYCEALGGQAHQIQPYIIKDIHNIVRAIGGWEQGGRSRCPRYGTQTMYVRVKVAQLA